FFTVPGCPTCTHPLLTGTGFDGTCGEQICGGSTGWLTTTAPVLPGETLTMHFSIWDMSDRAWDSTVLIDHWRWSPNPAEVGTGKLEEPEPPVFEDGYFVRDYDATGVCPEGTSLRWTNWSWQAVAPSDSYIDFRV